jgi:hypothetical protein
MVSTGDHQSIGAADLIVQRLGEARVPSPMARLIRGRASSPHYVSLRYVDPGWTAMVVGRGRGRGHGHGRFVHLPIGLATGSRNQVDPGGDLWMSVLEATGQPPRFG